MNTIDTCGFWGVGKVLSTISHSESKFHFIPLIDKSLIGNKLKMLQFKCFTDFLKVSSSISERLFSLMYTVDFISI